MTCLYCLVCGDPTSGDKTCSDVCSDARQRELDESERVAKAKLALLCPGIGLALQAWCERNACCQPTATLSLAGDSCRVCVRVGTQPWVGPLISADGPSVGGLLVQLSAKLSLLRQEKAEQRASRASLRLIQGGKSKQVTQ